MFNKSALLLSLIVYSSWQLCHCMSGDVSDDVTPPQQSPDMHNFNGGFSDLLNAGTRSLEPWLKSMGGLAKALPIPGPAQQGSSDPIKTIMDMMQSPSSKGQTQSSASTEVSQDSILAGQNKLLETPSKMVGALTGNNFNLSQVTDESPIKELTRVSDETSKVFSKISGIRLTAPPEDETAYFEYAPSDQWDGHRRPKYFSKECNFRIACEFGRTMRPMLGNMANQLKTNKVIQDLQSRYSRAMSYGTLNDNCDRYYCAFLNLFGGPQKFVSAAAEIISRVAAPEPESTDVRC